MEFKVKYLNAIDKKYFYIVLLLWLSSFMFNIWPFVFLAALCILNALLLIYDRYVDAPIDLELSTFSAIIMTLTFGVKWGIIAAVMTKVAVIISNRDFNKNSLIAMSSYVLAALATHMLPPMNIILLGVIVVMVVNLNNFIVFKYLLMLSDIEIGMYSISNILFNVMLFIGFAEVLIKVLTLLAFV
ncbi:MAG: hypothetical protein KKF44_09680 [Nanoarchaeota archaeon]|nr:hypothetical protein [Nanoarchaeota archaeon]